MTELDPEIFDDAFHSAAFAAYVELATQCGGQPNEAATRRLAYQLYENVFRGQYGPTGSLQGEKNVI